MLVKEVNVRMQPTILFCLNFPTVLCILVEVGVTVNLQWWHQHHYLYY